MVSRYVVVAYVSGAVLFGLGVARTDAVRQAALSPTPPAAPTVFAASLFPIAKPPGPAGERIRPAGLQNPPGCRIERRDLLLPAQPCRQ
ncbi:MAG: hypothetical protein ACRDSH_10170 [Pseudonocardiaceae bacterium]